MSEFLKRITQVREAEHNAASGSDLAPHAAATADHATAIDRTVENVIHRARASASSEDPDHISCEEFAALKARRVAAITALGVDPILPSQTDVLPSQDQLLRELSCIGLTLRAHASACGGCAAQWYAARLFSNHHSTPNLAETALDALGGAQ
jgi:hypothetical protein